MDRLLLLVVFLMFVSVFGLGFVVGYAVRAGISHHRRAKAERQRLVIH